MIGHLYIPLLAKAAVVPPSNGPTGGLSWLRGRKPKFDYRQR